jgi:hypothetical protein
VTGWSVNLQATEAVRQHALDDDDKRALLETLGLVAPGSRVLVPDPAHAVDVSGAAVDRMVSHVEPGPTDRPRVSFAPPGLRDYATTPVTPATPAHPGTPADGAQASAGAANTAQSRTTPPTPTGAQP